MAHIVAAEPEGPRGESPLTADERRGYHNLILLCSHCHDIVDADVAQFPVEVLHKIKEEHQEWVANSLATSTLTPDDAVYANIIDQITTTLDLDGWSKFVTQASSGAIPAFIIAAKQSLQEQTMATLWPGTNRKLETAIAELINAFSEYIDHFSSRAKSGANGDLVEDRAWCEEWNSDNYSKSLRLSQAWAEGNYWRLCRYAHCLNAYADTVRQSGSPMYFRLQGLFLIKRNGVAGFQPVPPESQIRENLKKLETASEQ